MNAGHKGILPPLRSEQMEKLKDITLLTSLEARKVIPVNDLKKELDMSSRKELEDYMQKTCNRLVRFQPLVLFFGVFNLLLDVCYVTFKFCTRAWHNILLFHSGYWCDIKPEKWSARG